MRRAIVAADRTVDMVKARLQEDVASLQEQLYELEVMSTYDEITGEDREALEKFRRKVHSFDRSSYHVMIPDQCLHHTPV